VFFTSGHANQYAIAVISEDFYGNSTWIPTIDNVNPDLYATNQTFKASNLTAYDRRDKGSDILKLIQNGRLNGDNATDTSTKSNYTSLNSEDCILKYTVSFPQDIGDLIVISSEHNTTEPLLWTRFPQRYIVGVHVNENPFYWMCQDIPKSASFDPEIVRRPQPVKYTTTPLITTGCLHPTSGSEPYG
jgi:hypothetical protein